MGYKFIILDTAHALLKQLDAVIVRRIVKKLQWLADQDNPTSFGVLLRSHDAGDIRFRVGDYRIIGVIESKKKQIFITRVGHKSTVYRP